jgi:hypothetical protein
MILVGKVSTHIQLCLCLKSTIDKLYRSEVCVRITSQADPWLKCSWFTSSSVVTLLMSRPRVWICSVFPSVADTDRCPDHFSYMTIVWPFLTWQSKLICTHCVCQNAVTVLYCTVLYCTVLVGFYRYLHIPSAFKNRISTRCCHSVHVVSGTAMLTPLMVKENWLKIK